SSIIQTRAHLLSDLRPSRRLGRGYLYRTAFTSPTLIRPDNERDESYASQIGFDGAIGTCSLVPFMKRAKGGEIRDKQDRRISALCATVRGNRAHLSGRGKAGDPARPSAGLAAFGASCASQPPNRTARSPACNR